MQEVVARLQTLSRLPPAEMEALCSDLRALLTGKSVTNQLQAIRKFLEEIHATLRGAEKFSPKAAARPFTVRHPLTAAGRR